MAKYLVIVESPAKVKTIKKFLGKNYEVLASNGHVRDLPKSSLGIDVEGDFDPKYAPFIKRFEDNNIEFKLAGCSGHAYPFDLIEIIDLIKPKLLVPIHSYHPERLYNKSGERLLPEKKQTI